MRDRKLTVAIASACTLGLVAGLGATALIGSASAAAPKAKYDILLNGANEVGGGDPDGTGGAKIIAKGKTHVVCVTIKKVLNISPAFAAHIHQADAGVNGPIVVTLAAPVGKAAKPGKPAKPAKSKACANVSATLLDGLLNDPSNFYVNVHTGQFPNGAIRGQLA